MRGWNSEMQVVFEYPSPSIPTHFQLDLIENYPSPINSMICVTMGGTQGWIFVTKVAGIYLGMASSVQNTIMPRPTAFY